MRENNIIHFIEKIKGENWKDLYAQDAEKQYNIFHNRFYEIFNAFFPKVKTKIKERKNYTVTEKIKDLKKQTRGSKNHHASQKRPNK